MVFHCLTPFDYMAWQCGPWQLLGRDELQTLVARKVPGPDSWHGRLQPTMMLNYRVLECLQNARFTRDQLNYNDWLQHVIWVPQFTLGGLGSIHINTFLSYLALTKIYTASTWQDVEDFSSWSHMLSGLGISLICAFWWWAYRCHLTFLKPQTEKGNGESGWLWVLCNNKFIRLPLGS